MSISAWEKLCFLLSNTLLLQHPTPSCVLILPVAVKGLYPNEELLSLQGIFILQTEDWNLFLSFSLSSWAKQKRGWAIKMLALVRFEACSLSSKAAGCIGRIPNKYFISSLSRGGEMGLSEMSGLWGFLLAVPTVLGRGRTCHSLGSSVLKPEPFRTQVP